jgi:hypothetical protein
VGGQHHAPAALPPGKTRYPLYRWLGGPQGRSKRVRKISPPPTGIRPPDRPTRSQSLYNRLYYFITASSPIRLSSFHSKSCFSSVYTLPAVCCNIASSIQAAACTSSAHNLYTACSLSLEVPYALNISVIRQPNANASSVWYNFMNFLFPFNAERLIKTSPSEPFKIWNPQ